MAADKFPCPKCGITTNVQNVVHSKGAMVRYRNCRICSISFSTVEAVKESPRLRQLYGEELATKLWGKPGFKYRNPSVPRAGKKWDKSSS